MTGFADHWPVFRGNNPPFHDACDGNDALLRKRSLVGGEVLKEPSFASFASFRSLSDPPRAS